ncbi:hypothetical protein AA098_04080 [Pseudomonas sp. JY-Q]|nr:hypothetical protein AA098_04080 [Pseudomonas sp. JY-Q]
MISRLWVGGVYGADTVITPPALSSSDLSLFEPDMLRLEVESFAHLFLILQTRQRCARVAIENKIMQMLKN